MISASRKLWRDSASLIVLARNAVAQKGDFNYKVLLSERPAKMSFMPHSTVFPGGATDVADESQDWLQLYKSFGVSDQKMLEVSTVSGNRPFIFHKRDPKSIERDVSLRITAIRETFEELGILICKNKDQFDRENPLSTCVTGFDIPKWQIEVQKDASKFLDLCHSLQVVPDLWSTYEWADWLTPTSFGKKRFEAAFYAVALESQPDIIPHSAEVEKVMWENPKNVLNAFANEKLWLPPPQVYELSRLVKMPDFNELMEHCVKRNRKGITLYFPVQFKLADGMLFVYPGDDLYPKEPDFETKMVHDTYKTKSLLEMRSQAKHLNRSEQKSSHKNSVHSNVQVDEHILAHSAKDILPSKFVVGL